MRRNDCYGKETQEESYEVHEETWGASNGHHNRFPGIHVTNGAHHGGMFRGGNHGSFSIHHGHFSGGGHKVPFGGAPMFPNGPHHGHQSHGHNSFSEVNKYEEMGYERHGCGGGARGGHGFCENPYERNRNNGYHKVEWGVKGV